MSRDLDTALAAVADRLPGTLGVAIRYLPDGPAFALNADQPFPTASVIKVPVLVEVFAQARAGQLALAQRIPLRDEDRVGGSGVLQYMGPGLEPSVQDLAELMIGVSDNTATYMLIELVGVGAVNARLRSLGLQQTTLAGKLGLSYPVADAPAGRAVAPQVPTNRGSVTTPAEMCRLFELLWRGEVVDQAASRAMIGILEHQAFMELARYLPLDDLTEEEGRAASGVRIASKSGSINGVRNDVGLITAQTPKGTRAYVVSAFTRDVEDHRLWTPQNVALLAIGEVSRLAYRYLLDVLAA